MSWTDFPPFTVGQVVTEEDLNALTANLDLMRAAHSGRAYLTSDVPLTNGIATLVNFSAEDIDTDGYHSTGSNPSRLTVPAEFDGLYIVHAQAQFSFNASGQRSVLLRQNGATTRMDQSQFPSTVTPTPSRVSVTTLLALAEGDYVEMLVTQTSGSTINVMAGTAATFLELAWRGRL